MLQHLRLLLQVSRHQPSLEELSWEAEQPAAREWWIEQVALPA
jgi:hypothetical protein